MFFLKKYPGPEGIFLFGNLSQPGGPAFLKRNIPARRDILFLVIYPGPEGRFFFKRKHIPRPGGPTFLW